MTQFRVGASYLVGKFRSTLFEVTVDEISPSRRNVKFRGDLVGWFRDDEYTIHEELRTPDFQVGKTGEPT